MQLVEDILEEKIVEQSEQALLRAAGYLSKSLVVGVRIPEST